MKESLRMTRFKQYLLYAGLEKEQFEELLPEAREENSRNLVIYSSMMVFIFSVCLLLSVVAGGGLVVNRPIYIVMVAVGFILYFAAKYVLPERPELSTLSVFIFIVAMYGYSFSVSLLHSEMAGTASVAILLVMPALFNYRPIQMILLTIIAIAVYCSLSAMIKEPSIAFLDLWNCLFFGTIAVLLSVYLMRVKFRMLRQKLENRILSENDLLTGVKNRNCYENDHEKYASSCKDSLACVFADANGLHELNDTKGHEEGDRMLKTVAKEMADAFGKDHTYRLGGDEFVSFCTDVPENEVTEKMRGIVQAVSQSGYSVSAGVSFQEKKFADVDKLVKDAEHKMYSEKNSYYQDTAHDRRRR